MAYPPISPLPSPPSRQDPANFANEADAFLGALPTFQAEVNAAGAYVDTKASEVDADATAAAASAASAAASAAAASQEAAAWVSGASYTVGAVVYSPITYSTFRAITTHSGITDDPSVDTTNWINTSGINTLSGFGVTASAAELNYNDITAIGVSEASKVVTANASGDVFLSEELTAKSYNETFVALSGTTPSVNCEAGNVFALTTSGNTTFMFGNPPASGTAYGFTLKVTAGGTHTLTWPASVDWAGGTAPDAPASGETNVLVFLTHDGGTTWYGFQAGAALA